MYMSQSYVLAHTLSDPSLLPVLMLLLPHISSCEVRGSVESNWPGHKSNGAGYLACGLVTWEGGAGGVDGGVVILSTGKSWSSRTGFACTDPIMIGCCCIGSTVAVGCGWVKELELVLLFHMVTDNDLPCSSVWSWDISACRALFSSFSSFLSTVT